MMTYYAETFAPNRGMFYHTAKPNEVTPSAQIVTLMNNHALYAGYYRQTLLTLFSILKYNVGGIYCYWTQDYGPKIDRTETGEVKVTDQLLWAGNRIEALDLYNTFWDPSVSPIELHRHGEWGARTFMRSHYWLAERAARGVYFNCEEALENDTGLKDYRPFYRSPPTEANISNDESTGGRTDWVAILREVPEHFVGSGFEITEVLLRVNPNDFSLLPRKDVERNRYELWRFTLLNGEKIIETTPLNNAHGWIPFFAGHVNDGIMGAAEKSPAEIIQPLQNFASHLLNVHVKANRKKIWGVTFYDPTVVDYNKIPDGEVAAYIPIESSGYGRDVNEAIHHDHESLETKQTMQDLSAVMDVINQFFPTQALPANIAGIDRAISSQVAAVQQGTNRRQQKGAKLLDDSLFRPARSCMYWNIIQFQQDNVEVSDFTGTPVQINLTELRQTDLPFIIGQGLKAIDRMAIADKLQQIIFALLQSQKAQEVDILRLIDYWTSMMDVEINFEQFRLAPQEQPQIAQAIAENAGQENGGTSTILPITDPAQMTEPLR